MVSESTPAPSCKDVAIPPSGRTAREHDARLHDFTTSSWPSYTSERRFRRILAAAWHHDHLRCHKMNSFHFCFSPSHSKRKVPQRVAARNSSEKLARHENSLTSKLAVSASPTKNCSDVRSRTMYDVSVVTLTRTDTTLDHSQKAEKVCCFLTEPPNLLCAKL